MRHDMHIRLPAHLAEQLASYCSWRNTTQNDTVCQAIQQLLAHAEQPLPGRWHP